MQKNKQYFGCKIVQRTSQETVPFFTFYARSRDVKEWAGIKRVGESDQGTQRLLRETRMKSITRFLKADFRNTIPNSILLAFEPGQASFLPSNFLQENPDRVFNGCEEQLAWGFLEFSFDTDAKDHEKPALIVDGQHRLYGISNYAEEDLPILVVSLIEAPLQEQAFQFVVINNKAVRVPTDNVRAIIAKIDEDELQTRLLAAGVSYGKASPLLRDINDLSSSPFKDLLDWPYNKTATKLVPLSAIEQAIRYIKVEFKSLNLDDDEASLTEIFCAVWRAIQSSYPELWGEDDKEKQAYKFMTKVNINALNEFIVERLKFSWEMGYVDIFDSKAIERQVLNIVELLPKDFWEAEWSIRIQDNANVRNLIKSDLTTLINNSKLKKAWNDDLKLPLMSPDELFSD
ncbi:MAG: DGQHR domain-containing protein [Leptolyngbya sp. BL-A-14]